MSLDFNIFLGATVAGAAARLLYLVYDPKKLRDILKVNLSHPINLNLFSKKS